MTWGCERAQWCACSVAAYVCGCASVCACSQYSQSTTTTQHSVCRMNKTERTCLPLCQSKIEKTNGKSVRPVHCMTEVLFHVSGASRCFENWIRTKTTIIIIICFEPIFHICERKRAETAERQEQRAYDEDDEFLKRNEEISDFARDIVLKWESMNLHPFGRRERREKTVILISNRVPFSVLFLARVCEVRRAWSVINVCSASSAWINQILDRVWINYSLNWKKVMRLLWFDWTASQMR